MKILVVLVVITAIIGAGVWPTGSSHDYKSANVNTPDILFTNVRMAAYDHMSFQFTQNDPLDQPVDTKGAFGKAAPTRGGLSKDGGVLIRGEIENVTNYELFIIDAFPPSSFESGDPPFLQIYIDGQPSDSVAAITVSDTTFAQGGADDEFAGYNIRPNEQLKFELIVIDLKLGPEDDIDLSFEWRVLNPANFEVRTIHPEFHFTPNGSTYIWSKSKEVRWKRLAPTTRTD